MLLVLPKNLLFILPPPLGSNRESSGKSSEAARWGKKPRGFPEFQCADHILSKKETNHIPEHGKLSSHFPVLVLPYLSGWGHDYPASLPHSMFPSQE